MECLACSQTLQRHQEKFCSNKCQKDFQYIQYISRWKQGLETGNRGVRTFALSRHLIRYLFEKYQNSCVRCNWNEPNSMTGTVPLEVNHIDGNFENNSEPNLELICPNCHSLTSNYRNLNKGNGRLWRREKYVKIRKLPL